jgi:hypothetical protein
MNKRSRSVYLLAAILALSACVRVGRRHHETITRNWPVGEVRRLEVHEVNGTIRVEAGPPNEISLVAEVRSNGGDPKPDRENHGIIETRLEGDTLEIGQNRRHSRRSFPFIWQRDDKIDYTVRVPSSFELSLHTVNGKIAASGVNGETEAVSVNGTIDLTTAGSHEVIAKTVNGRIRARFLEAFQGATLKTVNGGVDLVLPQNASFACDTSQVNGDFEASFPLSIHSHPGSRRVSGEVNGGRYELRVVTVNGDIRIDNGNGSTGTAAIPTVPPVPAVPGAPPPPASLPASASANGAP